MESRYALGLDYGTNSARCLVVRVADGAEIGTAVYEFEHGDAGILLDRREPELARQHPADYLRAVEECVPKALAEAREADKEFAPERVIGIGVDTTASTPIPVDEKGAALASQKKFEGNLNAMAWLWKDHTSIEEASWITHRAAEQRPEYLAKCGGSYSSEWFFSKIWHCLRADADVFRAAHTWVECCDWIPAVLCGIGDPAKYKRGICAAGHKGLFHTDWGGYPDRGFLEGLAPELGGLRDRLPNEAYSVEETLGGLSAEWAKKTGLKEGTPVAVGAIDAHLGAVGSGIRPGTLVKIMGTSTCDMMVWPLDSNLADIPGLCGIVPGSILPGHYGLEAGQAAVGDIFNWFVNYQKPGGERGTHDALTKGAGELRAGESGLLALDWNNGNRTVLADQRLTGLIVGQTLHTTPEEIYRALIEATAFGALKIINRFEEYGVHVREIVNCGGIAEKNPTVMQIYADVTGRPMKVSRSPQTPALGAAMCGAVAAGKKAGGHGDFDTAAKAMTGVKDVVYEPNPASHETYRELYALYSDLHDAFGTATWNGNLGHVMKRLIEIRNRVRKG